MPGVAEGSQQSGSSETGEDRSTRGSRYHTAVPLLQQYNIVSSAVNQLDLSVILAHLSVSALQSYTTAMFCVAEACLFRLQKD